jgi:hypothetical protein
MNKQLIYIVIDKENNEPILSALSEDKAVEAIDQYCGISKGQSEIILNKKIIYDGEWEGNLIRVITTQNKITQPDEYQFTDVFEIWCVELI